MTYPSLRVVSGPSVLKERLAQIYAARSRGDIAAFVDAFADDGVLHIIGDSRLVPESGPRQGREAIRKALDSFRRSYDYIDAIVVDIIVDRNRAAVRQHLTLRAKATGAVGEFDVVDMIRFRDGEIEDLTTFIDTASLAVLSGRV